MNATEAREAVTDAVKRQLAVALTTDEARRFEALARARGMRPSQLQRLLVLRELAATRDLDLPVPCPDTLLS